MKNEKSSKFRFICVCYVCAIIVLAFLVLSTVLTVVLLHHYKFITFSISKNNIYVPKGKVLYDLNTFTMRNSSIYRFGETLMVLDENEEFAEISTFKDQNEENVVLLATRHNNIQFSVKCEGICNCYRMEYNDDRRISSLVYSTRYASIVLISVLGLASAKFVNNHIDRCYEEAKRVLGGNVDDVESLRSLLTCSMDKSNCDGDDDQNRAYLTELEEEVLWGEYKERKAFRCEGHCLTKKIGEGNSRELEAIKKMNCENKILRSRKVVISEDEVFVNTYHVDKQYGTYWVRAVQKYRTRYLTPHCKSFETVYTHKLNFWVKIQPCCSTQRSKQEVYNIKCEEIPLEIETIDE